MFQAFTYVHRYPKNREIHDHQSLCGKTKLYNRLVPLIKYLGTHMSEIHWSLRLNTWNHVPQLPEQYTVIADTFPVRLATPRIWSVQQLYYSGYHGYTCIKFQNVIFFQGVICCFTGPHLGPTADNIIWQTTMLYHILEPWEWVLYDGAGIGEDQVLTPLRNPEYGELSDEDYLFNAHVVHYRARVEHINNVLTRHAMFKGVYRGSMNLLRWAMDMTANTTNVGLRMRHRYDDDCGPWYHDPAKNDDRDGF